MSKIDLESQIAEAQMSDNTDKAPAAVTEETAANAVVKQNNKQIGDDTLWQNEIIQKIVKQTNEMMRYEMEQREAEDIKNNPHKIVSALLDEDQDIDDYAKKQLREKLENKIQKTKLNYEQAKEFVSMEIEDYKNHVQEKIEKKQNVERYMKGYVIDEYGKKGLDDFQKMLTWYDENHFIPPEIFKSKPIAEQKKIFNRYIEGVKAGNLENFKDGKSKNPALAGLSARLNKVLQQKK